jgi:NAD(P)-dependent dehydrogenase (short-subunit alcohol dehydrogenase family)
MNFGLSDKVAFVTGSYRGTGAGIASSLSNEGVHVIVHGFEKGQTDDVVKKIRDRGGIATPVEVDILSDDGISTVENLLSEVDILVNCYGKPLESDWGSIDRWAQEWEQNVLLGVKVTQAVLGGMKEREWGRIVFVGTVGVEKPSTHSPGYYGAKSSLHTIVRTLAMELKGTGITTNLINPGMIATNEVKEMLTRAASKRDLSADWESVERWAASKYAPNLTGRIPSPNDIGDIVTFLTSELAWYINGASIAVDGGSVDA